MKNTAANDKKQIEMVSIPKNEYDNLKERLKMAETVIKHYEEIIKGNRRKMFGSASEKRSVEEQDLFFNEAEANADAELEVQVTETATKVEAHTRKRRKVNLMDVEKLPANLPVEVVTHELPEAERTCGECGTVMTRCGEYEQNEIKIIPEQIVIVRHVYYTYNCPECKKNAEKEQFKKTPLLPQVLSGSRAGAEALAYIMTQKYMMHLPLYRQAEHFKALGLPLSRQTMSNWILGAAGRWLEPIYERLHERLLGKEILHADETTLQVLKENGKNAKSKSYMWLYRTGMACDEQIVLYDYKPDRKACNPEEFLKGAAGYLHADGYAAYKALEPKLKVVGCLAHARRKFWEALQDSPKEEQEKHTINEVLDIFGKIAQKEKEYAGLGTDERQAKRREEVAPLMAEMKAWVEKKSGEILSQSKYGKALGYTRTQWDYLVRFLEDGRLEATNNLAERSIKPFVMGRKNWLFNDCVRGAKASAVIYSLIETAKANKIDPYSYLLYIFQAAPVLAGKSKDWTAAFMPESVPEFCHAGLDEENN